MVAVFIQKKKKKREYKFDYVEMHLLKEFYPTIRILYITDRIFHWYLNIDPVINNFINRIMDEKISSKYISLVIYIMSVNSSIMYSLMDL
jgi:hypothetical protein